jgi:predicted tellurium resistance membrane protein TerC
MGIIDILLSLLLLTFIEIIMGVDNLVFISVVTARLPAHQQRKVRQIGLMLAMVMRLGLLAIIVWLASLTKPLFDIGSLSFSIRDLILISGGLFLIYKSIEEIIEHEHDLSKSTRKKLSMKVALFQIILFDLLFSLDSIITAVGVANVYWVMATAIVICVLVMLLGSELASRLIMKNPRIRVLALCILFLIGIKLVLDGLTIHLSTGYVFSAMGFALVVEIINNWLAKREHKNKS